MTSKNANEVSELRDEIFSLLLVRPSTKFCYKNEFPWDKRNTFFRNMLSIMLVCRQFRQEAMAIFFRHNHCVFYQVSKQATGWTETRQAVVHQAACADPEAHLGGVLGNPQADSELSRIEISACDGDVARIML